MGGGASITYCVPVTQKPEGESSIYRNPLTKDKLYDRPQPALGTMKEIILNSYKYYGKDPALGTIVTKNNQLTIQYITYKEFVDEAQCIGSGIIHKKIFNTPQGEKLKFVGIFSKNRKEWAFTDIGCLLYGITTIPLCDTLGDQNITYVLKHTELETVFVNQASLKLLIHCKDLDRLKNIVCYDVYSLDQADYFKQKGVNLIPFEEVLKTGKDSLIDYNTEEYKVLPDDCLTFSYTSGTTGPPKGVMLSHKNLASFIAAEKFNESTKFCSEDVGLSYLPLPHILQRQFDYAFMYKGAKIVYFSGDVQKLKEDLAIVKPTVFLSVPRLFSRFYDALQAKFKELQGFTKTALEYALNSKLQNLKKTGSYTHRVYDRIFFTKTKQALGGRCRLMISGSAPLLPEVQSFLKVVLCAPLLQGYGQTQSTGAMLFSYVNDPAVKTAGGPVANFQVKMVDIPEMSYRSTDKDDQGRLTPRGQIWCRGPGVFLGYYHDEAKNFEALTNDGWLKTGDIGIITAGTRSICIIDRKKNLFKLQQGEYVAAEKIENIYLKGPLLAEIFIHGESTQTFVLAICVPHRKAFQELAASKGIQGDFQSHCKSQILRGEIVNYLNKIGNQAGLQGFEQAKNAYIEPQPFMNKGILTNTMKIIRHQAKKAYKDIITQLYKQGMLKVDKK